MDVKLPNLGEGADSGTVVNLFVKEGDRVEKDQPVVELENEKAVATIPSTAAGIVSKVFVKPGDKVTVGQKLISVNDGDAAPATAAAPAAAPAAKPAQAAPAPRAAAPAPVAVEVPQPVHDEPVTSNGPVAAAPSIRKMADDLGIDLSRIRGSERGGRIVLADVRAYIQRLQRQAGQARGTESPPESKPKVSEAIDFSKWGKINRQPLSPLRQTIARRMAENWNAIPHVTQFDRADITALNELRKKFSGDYEKKGARLTLTTFVLRIVTETL